VGEIGIDLFLENKNGRNRRMDENEIGFRRIIMATIKILHSLMI